MTIFAEIINLKNKDMSKKKSEVKTETFYLPFTGIVDLMNKVDKIETACWVSSTVQKARLDKYHVPYEVIDKYGIMIDMAALSNADREVVFSKEDDNDFVKTVYKYLGVIKNIKQ